MLYKSSSNSPSVQVLHQRIRGGWGVKACADFADAGGGGIPNQGKLADVILEHSLTRVWTKISFDKYSSVYPTYLSRKFGHFGSKVCPLIHISIEYIEVLLISISSGRSFN